MDVDAEKWEDQPAKGNLRQYQGRGGFTQLSESEKADLSQKGLVSMQTTGTHQPVVWQKEANPENAESPPLPECPQQTPSQTPRKPP